VIEIPSAQARAYLRSFGACVIAVTPRGLRTARDIGKIRGTVLAAYWTSSAAQALAVVQACRKAHSNDVEAGARQLQIVLTPHGTAVARAEAAVAKIDALLARAQADGVMRTFNKTYAQMRRQARAEGRGFMAYRIAHMRLQRALFYKAAGASLDVIAMALGTVKAKV
jgi:hypothetical protein